MYAMLVVVVVKEQGSVNLEVKDYQMHIGKQHYTNFRIAL